MPRTNRISDSLNNANLSRSAQASFAALAAVHNNSPAEQVVATAAAFTFICEHYGVSAQDAFTVTKNMINDAPRRQVPEFAAVRMYVENEL